MSRRIKLCTYFVHIACFLGKRSFLQATVWLPCWCLLYSGTTSWQWSQSYTRAASAVRITREHMCIRRTGRRRAHGFSSIGIKSGPREYFQVEFPSQERCVLVHVIKIYWSYAHLSFNNFKVLSSCSISLYGIFLFRQAFATASGRHRPRRAVRASQIG